MKTFTNPRMYNLPFDSLRPEQERALDWLHAQCSRAKMVEAPPGVGKTLLAAVYAYECGGGVILTETLSLLKQYESLGIPVIRGRANFRCTSGGTCEDGMEDDPPCHAGGCPYRRAKELALASPVFATTYASYFADSLIRDIVGAVICDEGHRLDGALSRWHGLSLTIPHTIAPSVPLGNDLTAWSRWAEQVDSWGADDKEQKRIAETLGKLAHIDTSMSWVVNHIPPTLEVLPVWPAPGWCQAFKHRNNIVLMSATLYGGALLASMLGEDDYSYLSLNSPFDPGRRPVHIVPAASLNWQSTSADWQRVGALCADIIKLSGNTKGLIHVSSRRQVNTMQETLSKASPDTDIIYHTDETRRKRQELFDAFRKTPSPVWMVSPSAFEGEDFPDEQLRAQIIAKVRYADRSDPLVAARLGWGPRGRSWYAAHTVANMCQAIGRSMRSEDDWGVTYITDGAVYNLLRFHRALWPEYILEAIQ